MAMVNIDLKVGFDPSSLTGYSIATEVCVRLLLKNIGLWEEKKLKRRLL